MVEARRRPGQAEMRMRSRMCEVLSLWAERWRRCGRQARHSLPWQAPKRRGRGREPLSWVDGTDDNDRERFRNVMVSIEAHERVARESADELGRADDLAPVRMSLEQMRIELASEPPTRIVVIEAHF